MNSQINTPGTELNRLLNAMGFPDQIGGLYGTALDQAIHNDPGVAHSFLDAFSEFKSNEFDTMLCRPGFAEAGHSPKPGDVFKASANDKRHHYYEREKIQQFTLGENDLSAFAIDGKVVDIGESMSPAAFEAKLRLDSDFRKEIEDQLGARIICDYTSDGSIKLAKPLPFFASNVQPSQKALARLSQKYAGADHARQVRDHRTSSSLDVGDHRASSGFEVRDHRGISNSAVRDHRTDATVPSRESVLLPIYSTIKKMDEQRALESPAQTQTGDGSDLSGILNDPTMPFEKKLALFLFAFADRKQKEIEKKTAALEQKKKTGDNGNGGGGLLGTLGTIGGAAAGAYFGGGAGVGIGSDIGGKIGSALEGGGGSTNEADRVDSEQTAMKKLQMEVEDMNKMFSLIDNILASMSRVVKEGPIAALRG